jgi:hypothetical protein
MKILATSFSICLYFAASAQVLPDTITLQCSEQTLFFTLNSTYKIDEGSYEEGKLWTVLTANSEVYDISCGGLNEAPVLRDTVTFKLVERCISSERTIIKGINTATGLVWVYIKFNQSKFRIYGRALDETQEANLYKTAASFHIRR